MPSFLYILIAVESTLDFFIDPNIASVAFVCGEIGAVRAYNKPISKEANVARLPASSSGIPSALASFNVSS